MDIEKVIRFIIKDPIRKIFAIVCAFGVWFLVAIGNDYNYTKKLKIDYINLTKSAIVVDSVSDIEVIFSGRGGSLLSIWASPPVAHCDLSQAKIGKNNFSSHDLTIPTGFANVSIKEYSIPNIEVVIDQRIEKPIKIIIPIRGSLKKGFSIAEITGPDTIRAVGPEKILRGLNEIPTESLDVENRDRHFSEELKILTPSLLIKTSEKFIKANVQIDTTSRKIFTNIPLKLIYSRNQLVSSLKKKLDTLIVEGAWKRLNLLKKDEIEVKIYLTKRSPGEYNLPAEIVLPEYIRPVYSVPKRFFVKVY